MCFKLYKIIAKMLDLPDSSRYNIYGPVFHDVNQKYSWTSVMNLILEIFEVFDLKFAFMVKNVLVTSQIDAEIRELSLPAHTARVLGSILCPTF